MNLQTAIQAFEAKDWETLFEDTPYKGAAKEIDNYGFMQPNGAMIVMQSDFHKNAAAVTLLMAAVRELREGLHKIEINSDEDNEWDAVAKLHINETTANQLLAATADLEKLLNNG